MALCKLCKNNPADKENSHIITKFLGKPLFDKDGHKYAWRVGRNGMKKPVQDTPKEDFILCTSCEKRMANVETYFARILSRIDNYKRLTAEFEIEFIGTEQCIICKDIHPTLFKLFVYSLVWRASISSLAEFQHFCLPVIDEEKIGGFLDKNLRIEHTDLMNSLDQITDLPLYHFGCISFCRMI